jgi:aspartate/methionine/tyrosine aminotransferase
MLAEIAMRRRDVVLRKTHETARQNLEHLDLFMAGHRETLGWIRPQGGMTAFPWLVNEENARHFCQAAAEQGILLAPGDCFDVPSHFRLGFAAIGHKFPQALNRLGEFVKDWPVKMASRQSA